MKTLNTKTTLPSAAELNQIHAEWMALDCSAAEKEKQRVFKLMQRLPRAYVSASLDLQHGAPIVDNMPVWAERRGIGEAISWLRGVRDARVDVAWIGERGHWDAIAKVGITT